jgi:DNA replication terminus site-binding protein
MDSITQLKICYANIQDRLTLLFDLIEEEAESINGVVYELPVPSNDDIGKTPEIIPVTKIDGNITTALTREHYFTHKLNAQRSGRILPRLPGVITIDHPNAKECMQRLFEINQCKDVFREIVKQLSKDKNERFRIVSLALPDLVKLQVFRHILFTDTPVKSIGFSWANRSSMKRMTRDEVLTTLEKATNYYHERQPLSDFAELVEKEHLGISQYPKNAEFIIRRPLRVAPMMNVRFYEPKVKTLIDHNSPGNMVAHSPLMVFNPVEKVGMLKNYIKNVQDKAFDNIAPVIPRLHLYKYPLL